MRRASTHIGLVIGIVLLGSAAGLAQSKPKATASTVAKMSIESGAFGNGDHIPKQFTGDGKNVSPPLNWGEPPASTRSLALTVEDPDAPRGTWVHWIIYNVPPTARRLKQGLAKTATLSSGITQGKNDFGKIGYNGPAPPRGHLHHYRFKLVALDTKLALKPGSDKKSFYSSIKGHVLARGQLTGLYSRD